MPRGPIRILRVGRQARELGQQSAMDALFITISCRLEPKGRGTRFPAVMDDLYSGFVRPDRAPAVLRELREIEDEARVLPVNQVLWNLDGRDDEQDTPVNRRATNVFDYFIDAEGHPLLSRLQEGVRACHEQNQSLRLAYQGEVSGGLLSALILAALGTAWMWIGHALFPNWRVAPVFNRKAGIPVWTVGMDLVMFGVGIGIAMSFPALRDWFRRNTWALVVTAVTAVVGWLVVCARAGFLAD